MINLVKIRAEAKKVEREKQAQIKRQQDQIKRQQEYKQELLDLKKLYIPKVEMEFDIPKILHLYWDGSPMSKLQTLTPITFHKQNPDWKINLYIPKQKYTGDDKYVPVYTGKDYFEKLSYVNIIEFDLKDYGIREDLHDILRSDIFRYQILYEQGGMWSDFDVLWLKPISHIKDVDHVNNIKKFGFNVCFFDDIILHHNIGILLSIKNHPFYKNLINQTAIECSKNKKLSHQIFGVDLWHNLYPSLSKLLKKYDDCLGIKYKTFYPYSIFALNKLYKNNDISVIDDNTICIHWFNGHSLTKEYINNGCIQECAMTYFLNLVDPDFYNDL